MNFRIVEIEKFQSILHYLKPLDNPSLKHIYRPSTRSFSTKNTKRLGTSNQNHPIAFCIPDRWFPDDFSVRMLVTDKVFQLGHIKSQIVPDGKTT